MGIVSNPYKGFGQSKPPANPVVLVHKNGMNEE